MKGPNGREIRGIKEAGFKEYRKGLKITDWIENYLHMNFQKDDWKKIFAEWKNELL